MSVSLRFLEVGAKITVFLPIKSGILFWKDPYGDCPLAMLSSFWCQIDPRSWGAQKDLRT